MGKSKSKVDSLDRRRPFREPRKLFLLVCGGSKTEPSYFEGLREKYRERLIRLDVIAGTKAPLDIVKKAISHKKTSEQQAADDFDHFDQVWCILDKDQFDLTQAINLAGENDINLAISNPCFELWLVLHFQDQRAFISTKDAQSLCQKLIPGYKKRVDVNKIWKGHSQAIKRARALAEGHLKRGNSRANPSTEIHRIIAEVEQSQWRSGFRKA